MLITDRQAGPARVCRWDFWYCMPVDCDRYGYKMTRPSLSSLQLLALLIALIAPVGQAIAADSDERWYQIELIIFENKNVDDSTETWSNDPGKPNLDNVTELHKSQSPVIQSEPAPTAAAAPSSATGPTGAPPPSPASLTTKTDTAAAPQEPEPFTLLPEDQLALNDVVKQLEDARDYHPLLHIGWRQPVPERDNGQPVLIDSRKLLLYTARIANDTPETNQPTGDDAAESDSSELLTPPPLADQGPDEIVTTINENFVSGTLTLTRGRYLHMGLDLLYERQANSPQLFSFFGFGNAEDIPEIYRLIQSRRMKRGEIHYFDHPKFGVLAMVTAVEDDGQDDDGEAQTIPLKPLH